MYQKIVMDLRKRLIKSDKQTFTTFEELIALLPEELQQRFEKLKGNPERTDYHPEGNTYAHIKIVTERLMTTGDINLIMAGVFHDLGKLETTRPNPRTGQPSAFGHERVSANLVNKFSQFIAEMGADPKEVYEIVNYHMRIKQMHNMGKKKRDEMMGLPVYNKLETFTKADSMINEFKL